MRVRMCMRACVRECVRACVRECVRACVCVLPSSHICRFLGNSKMHEKLFSRFLQRPQVAKARTVPLGL